MFSFLGLFQIGSNGRNNWQGRIQSAMGEAEMHRGRMLKSLGDARHILGQSTHTITPAQSALMGAIAADVDAAIAALALLQDKIEVTRNRLEDL